MKKYLIIFAAFVSISLFYSFNTYTSRADELLKSLGISSTQARVYIWKSFTGECVSVTALDALKNYSAGKRAELIRELGLYVKEYLLSSDFKRQYQFLRDESRPKPPASIQQRIDDQIKEYALALQASEAALRKTNPELKPVYDQNISKLKQRISALENEYDPQHSEHIQGILIQYGYDMSDFAFRLKQFEKQYPVDVRVFIKLRLQEFIQLSSTVDFNASFVESAGTKRFADANYEAKPAAWKCCFRAGKESTEAARLLAKQWLKEI